MHCIILLKRLGEKLVQTCRANLKSHFRFLQNGASLPLNKGQAWEKKQNKTIHTKNPECPWLRQRAVQKSLWMCMETHRDLLMSECPLLTCCAHGLLLFGEKGILCVLCSWGLRHYFILGMNQRGLCFVLCVSLPDRVERSHCHMMWRRGAFQCLAVRILQTSANQASWRQILRTRLTVLEQQNPEPLSRIANSMR